MELEGSLPCSQEPITRPYPEPLHPHPVFFRSILMLFSLLHLGLQDYFFQSFSDQIHFVLILQFQSVPSLTRQAVYI